jgi:hypothetical protein
MAEQAFSNGEYGRSAGLVLAGGLYGVLNAMTLGEAGAITNMLRVTAGEARGVAGSVLTKGVKGGEAGSFGALDARAVVGDGLTPHHMPQAAAGRTSRAEGGALVMTQAEHEATRTYGARGARTVANEVGLTFRAVLAKDVRDVRQIVGPKYNEGLRSLLQYYRENFPELMRK